MPNPSPAYAQLIASLQAGWARVWRGSLMAGADGQSLNRFDLRLETKLAKLEKELRTHTYETRPLMRFQLPKERGDL